MPTRYKPAKYVPRDAAAWDAATTSVELGGIERALETLSMSLDQLDADTLRWAKRVSAFYIVARDRRAALPSNGSDKAALKEIADLAAGLATAVAALDERNRDRLILGLGHTSADMEVARWPAELERLRDGAQAAMAALRPGNPGKGAVTEWLELANGLYFCLTEKHISWSQRPAEDHDGNDIVINDDPSLDFLNALLAPFGGRVTIGDIRKFRKDHGIAR